ncbi:MAG: TonB-dependent receptor [Bacteroidetes bacterium]|nr:MAG: TonB-dependent receptor [Bacteroidota bacterium]
MIKLKLMCLGLFLSGLVTSHIYAQKELRFQNLISLEQIAGVETTIKPGNVILKSDESGRLTIPELTNNQSLFISHPEYSPLVIPASELKNYPGGIIYLNEKSIHITYAEMTVSSKRFEDKLVNSSQDVEKLRAHDIERMNQYSTADVLAQSGRVMVQKSQLGGGSPIIRGFETNKVLLVVDGVRMNNAIYRGGHLQNVITLDNSVLDEVEIIFGPGSVIYGSDALGGVMHFRTRSPQFSSSETMLVKTAAYTRYSSASEAFGANAQLMLGSQKWASYTAFTYNDIGDLRQGALRNPFYGDFGKREFYVKRVNNQDSTFKNEDVNVQVGSGYKQYDLLQKLAFRGENIQHVINFQYSTSSDIPRYDRLTQMSGSDPKYGDWYYGPQKRMLASYHIDFDNKTRLYDHARLILAYQDVEESRNTRRYQKDFLSSRTEHLNIASLNYDLEKQIGNHDLIYGLEYYGNWVNSSAVSTNILTSESFALDTRYPDGGSQVQNGALFVTHSWRFHEKWLLNDGIRFNYNDLQAKFIDKSFFPFPFNDIQQRNMAMNGQLALIYGPYKNWRIRTTLSTGYRTPNVDDLSKVFDSSPGTIVVPNPDIKPEYTYNAELGISKEFHGNSLLSVTGYYTIYDQAITTLPDQFNGSDSILYDGVMSRVVKAQNAKQAYLWGIEANFKANIGRRVTLNSSLTYTYARIKTDSTAYPLDHIPPLFGRTGLELKLKRFRSEFFVMYNGWKRLKDYNQVSGEDNLSNATAYGMPAWYTLNLRMEYSLSSKYSVNLACENILDQNYRVFSSNISAPGRNFILTLRKKF